jgi:large subunit ribosomal protein L16
MANTFLNKHFWHHSYNVYYTPCRTLVRKIKRTARLWVRIQATVPVTKKPLGVRMGKGKGAIEYYACAVRPGQVIFEMDRVPRKVALSALDAVQPKFPCRLVFVEWS